jgi:hypothetical protein
MEWAACRHPIRKAYPAGTAPPAAGQPYRSVQPPDGYAPAVGGTRPYYSVPGAIPPGPAGSAKQDAILQCGRLCRSAPVKLVRDQTTQMWVNRCKVIHATWPDPRPTCGPRLALCNHRKTMSQRVPERVLTTASPVPFPPAQPVLPNRMQSCGRRRSRGCRSDLTKSVRDQTIRV